MEFSYISAKNIMDITYITDKKISRVPSMILNRKNRRKSVIPKSLDVEVIKNRPNSLDLYESPIKNNTLTRKSIKLHILYTTKSNN
jgi:hypothetical protein